MDRVIVYPQARADETDLLQTNVNAMVALGFLIQDLMGSSTFAAGLAVTPGSGLAVSVAPGRIYALDNVDDTAYSSIPADTALQIMKQGILTVAQSLAVPAPATAGDSIDYLIEASFEEIDTTPEVLAYYNSNNPTQPFYGQNNSGTAQYTLRQGQVVLQAKAGTPAATGSQTAPSLDSGCIGLAVVTVAYGASSIVTGNIAAYSGAPLIGLKLGATPQTGWGTPTGGTVVANFPGASATLVQTSEALAQVITALKAAGLIAA